MNAKELNNKEMDMVNGGDNTIVIVYSDYESYNVLGPVPSRRNRVNNVWESQLEDRRVWETGYRAN